ncbi:MAG: ABC transporter permease [Spirochaetaceae bacterium]|nr:ABC transporter permease [Spirochaetaceae bacterium]
MVSYLVRRVVYMLLLLMVLSFVSFVLIELPPGDALSTMIQQMRASGRSVSAEDIRYLEVQYGLNRPFLLRYGTWFFNLIQGDMGQSLIHGMPVSRLISERYWLTATVSFASLVFVFVVAVPIGIYSATHQYAPSDYVFTVFGFIGLATPDFLLALLLQFAIYRWTNWSVGGLFSPEYALAPWSVGKVLDLAKHQPLPLIVIGTAGTAGMIRVLRATLLDELPKQYVVTARTKGVGETRLLFKYPVRIAVNPIVSGIGGVLPTLVSARLLPCDLVHDPAGRLILYRNPLDRGVKLASGRGCGEPPGHRGSGAAAGSGAGRRRGWRRAARAAQAVRWWEGIQWRGGGAGCWRRALA